LQRRGTEARRQAQALNRAALLAHRLGLNWLETESGNDPASLSFSIRETAFSLRQAMELALLEPGALDRRWFDTQALHRTIARLVALQSNQGAAAALSEAGDRLRDCSGQFVNLLCDGQFESATQLSRDMESGREAMLGQLGALLEGA
jgi:methyl-accepting chemotaxis protein